MTDDYNTTVTVNWQSLSEQPNFQIANGLPFKYKNISYFILKGNVPNVINLPAFSNIVYGNINLSLAIQYSDWDNYYNVS